MTQQIKYIISDNKLYEEKETDLFTTYENKKVPQGDPQPQWKGPLIPWSMWQDAVAWCQITQDKLKSEALIFLFFDETAKKWQSWFLPQITNGMTVKANSDSPVYKSERKLYSDLQFGTIHHHCNQGAFASGVDKDDEIDRDGFHFTIGNIGSDEHSTHFRFSLNGCVISHPAEDWIEMDPQFQLTRLPLKVAKAAHKTLVHTPITPDALKHWETQFQGALANITKPTNTNIQSWNRSNKSNGQYTLNYGTSNIGYGSITGMTQSQKKIQEIRNNVVNWTPGYVKSIHQVFNKCVGLDVNNSIIRELIDYIKEWVQPKMLKNNLVEEDSKGCIAYVMGKKNWLKSFYSDYNYFETDLVAIVLDELDTAFQYVFNKELKDSEGELFSMETHSKNVKRYTTFSLAYVRHCINNE